MKARLMGILFLVNYVAVQAQTKTAVDQVVEGSKVLVELIKVLSSDKGKDADGGCRDRYADLCITNERDTSLTVMLMHRVSQERRELVILSSGNECSLQLPCGVWTYDLTLTGTKTSLRKGDLLIEGCNNVTMTIK